MKQYIVVTNLEKVIVEADDIKLLEGNLLFLIDNQLQASFKEWCHFALLKDKKE